jgi:hypothetical protein
MKNLILLVILCGAVTMESSAGDQARPVNLRGYVDSYIGGCLIVRQSGSEKLVAITNGPGPEPYGSYYACAAVRSGTVVLYELPVALYSWQSARLIPSDPSDPWARALAGQGKPVVQLTDPQLAAYQREISSRQLQITGLQQRLQAAQIAAQAARNAHQPADMYSGTAASLAAQIQPLRDQQTYYQNLYNQRASDLAIREPSGTSPR